MALWLLFIPFFQYPWSLMWNKAGAGWLTDWLTLRQLHQLAQPDSQTNRLGCTLFHFDFCFLHDVITCPDRALYKNKSAWQHGSSLVCAHKQTVCSSCVQALHGWVRLQKYSQIVSRDASWPWFFKSGISGSNLHFPSWHPSAQCTKYAVALTNKRTGCFLALTGNWGKRLLHGISSTFWPPQVLTCSVECVGQDRRTSTT